MQDLGSSRGSLSHFIRYEAEKIVNEHLDKKALRFEDLINEIQACFSEDTHPQDVMDGYNFIIDMLAKNHPIFLVRALGDESIPADPTRAIIASALGRAGNPSKEVMDALFVVCSHKNKEFRRAANKALTKLESLSSSGKD